MTENEMQKQNKGGKLKLCIGVLVLLLVAALAFYFGYWQKSPQYSLQIIRTSVEKHDLATFEQHVDVNNLTNKVIDDMVASTIAPEDAQNPLLQSMLVMVKNAAMPAFMSQVRTYVQTGKFNPVVEKDDGQEIAAATAQRTGLTTMVFKSIEQTKNKGDTAIITCLLRDRQLNQDFHLQLQMDKLADGTWKLVAIANLPEFLAAHDKAVAKKLAELNEPIAAKLAEKVQLISDGSKTYKVERITDNSNPLATSSVKAEFSFKLLDQQVTGVRGNVEIYDEHKDVLFSRTFDSENKDLTTQPLWGFATTWELNPYDSLDRNILKADMTKTTYGVVFTGITYKDGTKLDFLTDLPAEKTK